MSENSSELTIVEVGQQPIELCKLLKIANMVGGGGEAKIVISEGYVALNGEVEFQKRKKVYHEDVIEFNGEFLQLIVNESLAEAAAEQENHQSSTINEQGKTKQNKKKAADTNKKQKKKKSSGKPQQSKRLKQSEKGNEEELSSGRKRRPISF